MGRDYRPPARLFRFISGKPEAYLRKAIGCRAWVISSTSEGSKNTYWLAGMFKPEVVRPERDYFVIQGAGVSPRPPIEITTRRWFERLRQEQAGFSLGFNRIRDAAIVAELERCLVTEREAVFVSPEEFTTSTQYPEGATRKVSVDYYERNPRAREQCIKHHGCHCAVCGFDFEQSYGEIGKGFIHVHHLKALADIRGEYMVDRVEELRPICPNCHAMIHSGRNMLSIEELKNALRNRPT
jgi:5-methylcytosine-specific restriction protein A